MVKLRYNAGKTLSEKVHKIGIIALGSSLENHGIALPIDTDTKIASYIALNSSFATGAKFLGVIYPGTEYEYINHGIHTSSNELIENIIKTLKSAKNYLDINSVVIVNGHGGNLIINNTTDMETIKEKTALNIIFNNKIIEIEGPHGASGELSLGRVLGITDESKITQQSNLEEYGEIGLYKFEKARTINKSIEKGAKEVELGNFKCDEMYGKKLFKIAIESVIEDVKNLLKN
ncbi:MAG: 2-amino-5-formylamino-6-ribosylaminopyrimidin-4(3H)-one 5'-monophosphate deformylase [Methanobacteriaceae archaeon]